MRYHLLFVPAICFCLAAGWFELGRARDGRQIAWVYTFEWPLFGVLIGYMWWQVLSQRGPRRPSPPQPPGERDIPDADPGLQAWRAYLDALEHGESTDRAPGSG